MLSQSQSLRPRLCALEKGDNGYGFHLHGEKGKTGQFIRLVEPESPAESSGLRAGDRLVFVNGEEVENESHQQVVSRIRATTGLLELIVVDAETEQLLKRHNLKCQKEYVTDGVPVEEDEEEEEQVEEGEVIDAQQDLDGTESDNGKLEVVATEGEEMEGEEAELGRQERGNGEDNQTDEVMDENVNDERHDRNEEIIEETKELNYEKHNETNEGMINERCEKTSEKIIGERQVETSEEMIDERQEETSEEMIDERQEETHEEIREEEAPPDVTPRQSTPVLEQVHESNGEIHNHMGKKLSISSDKDNEKEERATLRPRLCVIQRGTNGYGFNLHSERARPGQFIRAVDEDSPAERAGLQPQDRIVQVNGLSVEGKTHSQVGSLVVPWQRPVPVSLTR
uniref:PDZ domain-containing protein n=1 Tax=Knipowitschia caucasica TaxID=637954 RepID=A0AAV2KN90_KNICA